MSVNSERIAMVFTLTLAAAVKHHQRTVQCSGGDDNAANYPPDRLPLYGKPDTSHAGQE